jgi:hypothetical protein
MLEIEIYSKLFNIPRISIHIFHILNIYTLIVPRSGQEYLAITLFNSVARIRVPSLRYTVFFVIPSTD